MKKLLFFCMSAAMLASCSSEEPAAPGNNGNTVTNPDEIVMGVSGLNVSTSVKGTKAAINEFFEGDKFTVFGLAKNADSDWTTPDDRLFDTGYATGYITGGATTYTMYFVDDLDAQKHYYYPGYNGNNYSFFACFPVVAVPVIEANQVTSTYTVDGKTDIMWAGVSAAALNGVEGYNASYFRQPGAQKPNLNFEHQLTQLVFKFKKGDGFGTEQLNVRNIKINNTFGEGVLTVATTANAGTPAAQFAGSGEQNVTMSVYNTDDDAIADATNVIILDAPADATEVGYTMLVPATTYELEVELYTGDDVDTAVTKTVTVQRPDGDFLAGTKYNVTFTISGQIEIEIAEVTVEPWQEEEVDGGEIAM